MFFYFLQHREAIINKNEEGTDVDKLSKKHASKKDISIYQKTY